MAESKDQALNPQNSEQVLSSINEWMVQQADAVKSTNPSIASEPSIKSSSSASQEHRLTRANKRIFHRARAAGRFLKGRYFAPFAAFSSPLLSLWCGRPIGTIGP